jgi:hypothetical protein
MKLDRDHFGFLLVNARSVVELGLLRFIEELEDNPPLAAEAAPTPETARYDLTPADVERLDSLKIPVYFDFEAMLAQETARREREAGAGEVAEEESEAFDDAADFDILSETGKVDIESYLARIYGDLPRLESKLTRVYSQANLSEILPRLEKLPADLPPLTGRLSAADMERWVEFYAPENALGALLADICSLAD